MNKINKKSLLVLLPVLLLIVLSTSIFTYKSMHHPIPSHPYTAFLKDVTKGSVADVYLSESESMKIVLHNNTVYSTSNPRSLNLKESLLEKGIQVHESDGNLFSDGAVTTILFTVVLLGAVFLLARQKSGNNSPFKLSAINAQPCVSSEITFNMIAGNAELKESMTELVDFIKEPEKYTHYDARMPRGVILYGPPGTGKTLMAKALATEAGVPFYAVNGSDFVQIYVGIGAGRIRDLFRKAREKGKAVIFIDELDAIGKKRDGRADGGSDERDQTLNALLAEMSGFGTDDGIIVMAATNRLDVLDDALLRPGRFDRHLEVGLPDVGARHEILQLHSRTKPLSNDVDLFKVAQMTVYFSGAKLEHLMNEAAIIAARTSSPYIDMKAIDKAFGVVIAGAEKTDRSHISETDRKCTAYHEAGHALISKLASPENTISKLTIIPSTKGAGGYMLNIPPDGLYRTRKQLLADIRVSLGGRAAEELMFGSENITTGAYGDIKHATGIVLAMARSYGMFEDSGLLSYELLESHGIADKGELVQLCGKMLTKLYNEVLSMLSSNMDKLEHIAEALLKHETLYEDDLTVLMLQE